ncbi:MAG: HDIG domain-containing protein [Desulfobacteraceae bacterium]|jgi:poly(A) polymerase/tRNA nucleotidyltransferase (CCA-adding enzyme)
MLVNLLLLMWYNLYKAFKIRGKDRKFYPVMDLTGKEFEAQGMDMPEFIVTVVEGLRASGYQAYIVGGAVRDYCLQRMVTDWDVATSATPKEIKSTLWDIRNFSLKHGTVTFVHLGQCYDVTTFRGSKGFGSSLEEDLGHRDFTINAMAYDNDHRRILDPHGGRDDLLRRVMRAVGDAKERFREDPLRLLRAVRLAAELEFRIESKTLETISMMAGQLDSVAPERIREELMKILLSQRPSVGFNLMLRVGLLRQLLPELLEGYRKKQEASHRYTIYKHTMETLDQVEPDLVLRLTALLHDIAKPRVRRKVDGEFSFLGHEQKSAELGREIMERLKFSHAIIGKVTHLIAHHMSMGGYDSAWTDGALRRLVRGVGSENMDYLLAFREADIWAHGIDDEKIDQFSELKKRIEALRRRGLVLRPGDLAIDGHEVMEILGLPEGPEVGRILEELVDKLTERPELNRKGELSALVKQMKDNTNVAG